MANECDFMMTVSGEQSSVESFMKLTEKQFRFFQRDLTDDVVRNGNRFVEMSGTCAWSMKTAGIDGNPVYEKMVELGISGEYWSTEPGFGFQEHALVVNGKLEKDEYVDYTEADLANYDSYEEAQEENPWLTEEEYRKNADDFAYHGGFENYGETNAALLEGILNMEENNKNTQQELSGKVLDDVKEFLASKQVSLPDEDFSALEEQLKKTLGEESLLDQTDLMEEKLYRVFDYYAEEFDSPADELEAWEKFKEKTDVTKVGLGFTSDGDQRYFFESTADLTTNTITLTVNNEVAAVEKWENDKEFLSVLDKLDFADLTYNHPAAKQYMEEHPIPVINSESIYYLPLDPETGREERYWQGSDFWIEADNQKVPEELRTEWMLQQINEQGWKEVCGAQICYATDMVLHDLPTAKTGGIDFTGQTVGEWMSEHGINGDHGPEDYRRPIEELNVELIQNGIAPLDYEEVFRHKITSIVTEQDHVNLGPKREVPVEIKMDLDRMKLSWVAKRTGQTLFERQYHSLERMCNLNRGFWDCLWCHEPAQEIILDQYYKAYPAGQFVDKDGEKTWFQIIDPKNAGPGITWRFVKESDIDRINGVPTLDTFRSADSVTVTEYGAMWDALNDRMQPGTLILGGDDEERASFIDVVRSTSKIGFAVSDYCDWKEDCLPVGEDLSTAQYQKIYLNTLSDLQQGKFASYRKELNDVISEKKLDPGKIAFAKDVLKEIKQLEPKQWGGE